MFEKGIETRCVSGAKVFTFNTFYFCDIRYADITRCDIGMWGDAFEGKVLLYF